MRQKIADLFDQIDSEDGNNLSTAPTVFTFICDNSSSMWTSEHNSMMKGIELLLDDRKKALENALDKYHLILFESNATVYKENQPIVD